MDKIYCDVVNQKFAHDFYHRLAASLFLTQNDDYPFQLFMVQPTRYLGSRYPFSYTEASGEGTCIVSLRDVMGAPLTLASTEPMTPIVNGFEGLLHLNTAEVTTFLSGRPELDAAFCIDMIDGSGNRISPFRRSVVLRATDSGAATSTQVPGVIYNPAIIGLTGGGLTNLDGIVTTAKPIGSLQILTRQVSGVWVESTWKLIAGTTSEDEDGGVVRPDDYAASTNEKVWVRVDGL